MLMESSFNFFVIYICIHYAMNWIWHCLNYLTTSTLRVCVHKYISVCVTHFMSGGLSLPSLTCYRMFPHILRIHLMFQCRIRASDAKSVAECDLQHAALPDHSYIANNMVLGLVHYQHTVRYTVYATVNHYQKHTTTFPIFCSVHNDIKMRVQKVDISNPLNSFVLVYGGSNIWDACLKHCLKEYFSLYLCS